MLMKALGDVNLWRTACGLCVGCIHGLVDGHFTCLVVLFLYLCGFHWTYDSQPNSGAHLVS